MDRYNEEDGSDQNEEKRLVYNTEKYGLFIRNFPSNISEGSLMQKLTELNITFIIGCKIEKNTCEINFSRRDASEKAQKTLNGYTLEGLTLKASLIEELNKCSKIYTSKFRKNPNSIDMEIEEEPKLRCEQKNHSILSRIKKAH